MTHIQPTEQTNFMELEVTACVIAAAFPVLGLESKQNKPKHFTIPENLVNQSKFHRPP